jgi:calmodulin
LIVFSSRQAFNAFDKDNSGMIDAEELGGVLRTLGQDVTDDEVQDMMNLADGDRSGHIDFWEFATLMLHKMADPNPDRSLKAAFKVFDANNDGMISAKELRKVMR